MLKMCKAVLLFLFCLVLCYPAGAAEPPSFHLLDPGQVTAGSFSGHILAATYVFSSIPSTTETTINGAPFAFEVGSLAMVDSATSTLLYYLAENHLTGQREWVEVGASAGNAVYNQETASALYLVSEILPVPTSYWEHNLPAGRKFEKLIAFTIDGAPFQTSYIVKGGASIDTDGGVYAFLAEGQWPAGAKAELVYTALTVAVVSAPTALFGVAGAWSSLSERLGHAILTY